MLPTIVLASPPWSRLIGQGSVEADSEKTYTIKEENGPCMVYACSFSGEGAEKQAKELVLELRKRYKMEAYLHLVHFKLDDPNGPSAAAENTGPSDSGAAGATKSGTAPRRWKYKKFHDRPEQYKDGALKEIAVLVGNFPSMDHPEAQKTLKKIKYAEPDCLKIDKGTVTSQTLVGLRLLQKYVEGNRTKDLGPMGHAFLINNPKLPADYFAPKGVVDELVLKINKDVEHSLLDCPGKYTVQVARFTGEVTIDQRKIQEIQAGLGPKKDRQPLAEAAEKANELTKALRMKGYEAYEFHDRYASIVTVGSFDSVGTPRADGKTEINPKVLAIMKVFGGEMIDAQVPGQQGTPVKLKQLAGIYFDLQPLPVEVPKRSISRELARRVVDE
jgi:hypothetical protein